MSERIVMLGGGAVGGYVGGHLALHGHDVTLIDFWHDNVEAIRKNGLELSGLTVTWGPPVRPNSYWKQGIFGRWKMICPR